MKETRTPEQIQAALGRALIFCASRGWKYCCKWVFRAPSGSYHDLSASNLDMLDYIEANGIGVVDPSDQH